MTSEAGSPTALKGDTEVIKQLDKLAQLQSQNSRPVTTLHTQDSPLKITEELDQASSFNTRDGIDMQLTNNNQRRRGATVQNQRVFNVRNQADAASRYENRASWLGDEHSQKTCASIWPRSTRQRQPLQWVTKVAEKPMTPSTSLFMQRMK